MEEFSNQRENKQSGLRKGASSTGRLFFFAFSIILASISVAFSGLGTAEKMFGVKFLYVQAKLPVEVKIIPIRSFEVIRETVREVTAYNVGVVEQTDEYPCIGATGDDLCERIRSGERICAANGFPLGTMLNIENYGQCLVLDRMNRRYKNRVDIAMGPDEIKRARNFGVQRLKIGILEVVD